MHKTYQKHKQKKKSLNTATTRSPSHRIDYTQYYKRNLFLFVFIFVVIIMVVGNHVWAVPFMSDLGLTDALIDK